MSASSDPARSVSAPMTASTTATPNEPSPVGAVSWHRTLAALRDLTAMHGIVRRMACTSGGLTAVEVEEARTHITGGAWPPAPLPANDVVLPPIPTLLAELTEYGRLGAPPRGWPMAHASMAGDRLEPPAALWPFLVAMREATVADLPALLAFGAGANAQFLAWDDEMPPTDEMLAFDARCEGLTLRFSLVWALAQQRWVVLPAAVPTGWLEWSTLDRVLTPEALVGLVHWLATKPAAPVAGEEVFLREVLHEILAGLTPGGWRALPDDDLLDLLTHRSARVRALTATAGIAARPPAAPPSPAPTAGTPIGGLHPEARGARG